MLASEMNALARLENEEELQRKKKIYATDILMVESSIRDSARKGKYCCREYTETMMVATFLQKYLENNGFFIRVLPSYKPNNFGYYLDIKWEGNILTPI